jgi:hypothetical protein
MACRSTSRLGDGVGNYFVLAGFVSPQSRLVACLSAVCISSSPHLPVCGCLPTSAPTPHLLATPAVFLPSHWGKNWFQASFGNGVCERECLVANKFCTNVPGQTRFHTQEALRAHGGLCQGRRISALSESADKKTKKVNQTTNTTNT